jgi:hypothetical protein
VTAPHAGCVARPLYRDRHLCVGSWWTVTMPDDTVCKLGGRFTTTASESAQPARHLACHHDVLEEAFGLAMVRRAG